MPNSQTLVSARGRELYVESLQSQYRFADRLFAWLMLSQYIGVILWALLTSPRTWSGNTSTIHPHVLTAAALGGLIAVPVLFLTTRHPGEAVTRYVVATCQMLMSALLIHVSGGRIETHFHVFGSLAFLAFYRDWRVLIPATLVVALDHVLRGLYFPLSVYGVSGGAEWRFLEHAGWVVFENIILTASCLRSVAEMQTMAQRQADIEETNVRIEKIVVERTSDLQKSEVRKSAVLDNALDAIVSMDSAGEIVEFNPAAELMFGIPKAMALGHEVAALLFPETVRDKHREEIAAYLETGESKVLNRRIEITACRSTGDEFPVELTVTPVQLPDGTMFTAFVRDITERRRLETDLAHAQKMESIGRLAAGVAHEINTPNQYIGDNIRFFEDSFSALDSTIAHFKSLRQAVREGTATPQLVDEIEQDVEALDLDYLLDEFPKAVNQALEGVERVASIVRAMKDFSHPGQDARTVVDVNRTLTSTATVARNEWKYVAEVEWDLDPNLHTIEGHPGELGQVFLNLIVNAAHAIAANHDGELGVIKITTRQADDGVEIVIEDNGCGIPVSAQKRVFEPFFTTKEVGIGTGQGLAISHSVIVDHHNGELRFETEEGKGTRFIIALPTGDSEKEIAA